jgi:hypothetical protein
MPNIIVNDIPDWRGITIGLYGPPDVGKSTAALGNTALRIQGAPRPLVLSCEDNLDAFTGVQTIRCNGAKGFTLAVDWVYTHTMPDPQTGRPMLRKGAPFSSLVCDGYGFLYGEAVEQAGNNEIWRAGFNEKTNPAPIERRNDERGRMMRLCISRLLPLLLTDAPPLLCSLLPFLHHPSTFLLSLRSSDYGTPRRVGDGIRG